MDFSENKKTALVTGASRGIGKAVAEALGKKGYDLVLTCRENIDRLNDLAEELKEKYGIDCVAKQVDAGNHEAVKTLFEESAFEEGLDLLVNNAGISYVGLLHEMSPEEWHRVMSVNLDSVFYTSKYAVPLMLKKHSGHIINISSVWGECGASTEVAYSASKGGVNTFTKALAKELAPSHIAVNAVCCGLIDTDMNSCFSKEELEAVIGEIPADRMGRPEEVAAAVCNLAEMPEYLTGQLIRIDGGWI